MGGHLFRGENAVKADRSYIPRGARRSASVAAALAFAGAVAFQASAAGDASGAKQALAPLVPQAAVASAAGGASASAAVQPDGLAEEAPPGEMPFASLRRSRPELSSEAPQDCASPEEYSIPMPWGEESFQDFRDAYLSADGKSWLAAIMARAEPYLPYIAERVRFYGLPDELAYLPVIESEYSPRAVSRSGASGLWQFMRNSIGGYGIRIDDWVDERRDFIKSTDAALNKLSDNYEDFGDWPLALAAYNAGFGSISRAEKRAFTQRASEAKEGKALSSLTDKGFVSFWELKSRGLLSKETRTYVPKFLAVASILRYSARNGLPILWADPPSWETVETTRAVDLVLLADAAKIPLSNLKSGNAELRYTVTPPYSGYRIKVPAESASAVKAALSDPGLKLIRYYLHTVRSGDTLSAIAKHYGTPISMISEANPGLKPSVLRIGKVIVVPALKEAGPMPAAPKAADSQLDFSDSYQVAKGDTLWSISLRYSVQPELLADKNGLSLSSVIHEGMRLRVPIVK
jgi:membrane-bound lytic murein transglycosylase D